MAPSHSFQRPSLGPGRRARRGQPGPSSGQLALALALLIATLVVGGCARPEARVRGVGGALKPFIAQRTDTGAPYCAVCAVAGKPAIMLVADVGDTQVEKTLLHIQHIVDAHRDQGLTAFAVLGSYLNGQLSPPPDEAATAARIEAVRVRLGLSIPVAMLTASLAAGPGASPAATPGDPSTPANAAQNGGVNVNQNGSPAGSGGSAPAYPQFGQLYELIGAPTVMFATSRNKIVFADVIAPEVADAELDLLETEIRRFL